MLGYQIQLTDTRNVVEFLEQKYYATIHHAPVNTTIARAREVAIATVTKAFEHRYTGACVEYTVISNISALLNRLVVLRESKINIAYLTTAIMQEIMVNPLFGDWYMNFGGSTALCELLDDDSVMVDTPIAKKYAKYLPVPLTMEQEKLDHDVALSIAHWLNTKKIANLFNDTNKNYSVVDLGSTDVSELLESDYATLDKFIAGHSLYLTLGKVIDLKLMARQLPGCGAWIDLFLENTEQAQYIVNFVGNKITDVLIAVLKFKLNKEKGMSLQSVISKIIKPVFN